MLPTPLALLALHLRTPVIVLYLAVQASVLKTTQRLSFALPYSIYVRVFFLLFLLTMYDTLCSSSELLFWGSGRAQIRPNRFYSIGKPIPINCFVTEITSKCS